MKTQYLLRIQIKTKKDLEKIAKEKGYSLNTLIMFIINDYLETNKLKKEGE